MIMISPESNSFEMWWHTTPYLLAFSYSAKLLHPIPGYSGDAGWKLIAAIRDFLINCSGITHRDVSQKINIGLIIV